MPLNKKSLHTTSRTKHVCHTLLMRVNSRIAPNNEKVHEYVGRVIQYYKCSVFYYGESKSILPEPIYNTRNIFSTQHRLREKKTQINHGCNTIKFLLIK